VRDVNEGRANLGVIGHVIVLFLCEETC